MKALFNQHLKRLNSQQLHKMRLPIPGGRHYVMPAAVGQRAGFSLHVERGQIHIDPDSGTAWVNDEDWLGLQDSAENSGIADILGGADNDILLGSTFNDSLIGGMGDDTLNGNDGDDTLLGGNGNDSLKGGSSGNDRLLGTNGNDSLIGGNGRDTLNGGSENDSLNGGIDDDILNGNDGDDTLFGGDGQDILRGGADNDSLMGNNGTDILFGNGGNDIFAIEVNSGSDIIRDFVDNSDLLSLPNGLTFADLTINAQGASKEILDSNGNLLATLRNVDGILIDSNDFI